MSAREKRRKSRPLKRTTATKAERRTFRIYTEGEATEPEYIDAVKRLPEYAESIAIAIEIARKGAMPLTLVEAARADKKRNDLETDEYWCVFDVESPANNPNLDRARDMAQANGISLAISNPCFELWLVLHHRSHTGYLTTDGAVRLRREVDESTSKHLDPALYLPHRTVAIDRARRLRTKHRKDGTNFPEDNPSSGMDLLLLALTKAATAAAAELEQQP